MHLVRLVKIIKDNMAKKIKQFYNIFRKYEAFKLE